MSNDLFLLLLLITPSSQGYRVIRFALKCKLDDFPDGEWKYWMKDDVRKKIMAMTDLDNAVLVEVTKIEGIIVNEEVPIEGDGFNDQMIIDRRLTPSMILNAIGVSHAKESIKEEYLNEGKVIKEAGGTLRWRRNGVDYKSEETLDK